MHTNNHQKKVGLIIPGARHKKVIFGSSGRILRFFSCVCLLLFAFSAGACTATPEQPGSPQETAEQIPGDADFTAPFDTLWVDCKNGVEAHYVSLPRYCHTWAGTIIISPEEDKPDFYEVGEKELAKLQTEHFYKEILYAGKTCPIEFNYCLLSQGKLLALPLYTETPDGFYCTCVHSCSGRPDTLLLTLSSNRQREYTEYKLLLDMSTGEITDFLKSCSLEKIAKIHNIDVSEDLAWAVIRSSEDEYYLCNINEGSLVLADDLFENEVEACKFLDDKTVYCSSEDGTAWSYELDTGNYTLVFTDDSEIEYLFGTYALRIEDTGATYVVSLKTGQETLVADYCYISGTSSVLSPDNSRILFAKRDDSIEEMGYKEFAVYNIRDGKLTILPRQGYEVRTEIGYGWLDDQRVEVMAMNSKGEYYCYFYKFP
ncbi:MAG TPA: hypothetical protein DDY38_01755 [Firmicutes bacterium]|nr:hypothetical protein [Bacillota bacterium]